MRLSMYMIKARVENNATHFIATGEVLLVTDLEIVVVVHCKPSVDKDTQKRRHKEVKAKNDHNLKLSWKRESQLLSV